MAPYANEPDVLLHHDLWAEHCFVDPSTGRLTAIIDFADARLGPAAWEFSWFSSDREASRWWNDELLAGYAEVRPVSPAFLDQVRFYRLVRAVRSPSWSESLGWPALTQAALAEIREQLEG